MKLGRLKKIDLRKAWKNEAFDFTNWLAQEDNLALLSEEIGINISLIETESNIGSFRADIWAEEENTHRQIIIENQLEITNHQHLGQIITYASGKDAEIIILIVKNVKDEHKQAIDWLNEHTDEKINFFAIKMELWQIGNSPYAPKFQVICKPNEWAKIIKKPKSEPNDRKLKLLKFWGALNEYLEIKKSTIKPQKPSYDHWNSVSIGSSKAYINFRALTKEKKIACDMNISDSKELYLIFEKHKEEIEIIVGAKLNWREMKESKSSLVTIEKDDFDLFDEANWSESFEWFENYAIKFKKAFGKYL